MIAQRSSNCLKPDPDDMKQRLRRDALRKVPTEVARVGGQDAHVSRQLQNVDLANPITTTRS